MALDNDLPLPRHFQLREAIVRDVLKNGMSSGDALPPERELAVNHNVSRITVRRAISDLVAEGFLRRQGRRGTFIDDVSCVTNRVLDSDRKLLGVLFSRIQTSFTGRLLHGMSEQAHAHGYNIVFGGTNEDPDKTAEQIDRMAEDVGGFIMVPIAGEDAAAHNDRLLHHMDARGIPFVLLDRYAPGWVVDTVVSDNFDGAYRATEHLVALGHRKIGFVGYLTCSAVEERISGYEKCLRDHGIFPDEALVTRPHPDHLKDTVQDLLKKQPSLTALFAVNDARAMLVWECLRELGLRVPDDIALVGYDNMYESQGPGALLTTTDQPLEEEGRLACKMLVERVCGFAGEPRLEIVKSSLIVGQSTTGHELQWAEGTPATNKPSPSEAAG